jgi:hypothetical protein
MSPRRPVALVTAALVLLAASAGCFRKKSGCSNDSDCKGARVCVDGNCQDAAAPAAPRPPPRPASHPPPPPPAPPQALAVDGLPVVIPPPGSPAPTNPEWDAVPREVTVAGSSALHCETKMLREWLRVVCRHLGPRHPLEVRALHNEGQQAFVYKLPGTVASTDVQVVRGKEYRALFTWEINGRHRTAELTVRWAAGAARPSLWFSAEM